MRSDGMRWTVAVLATVLFALWQRWSGPTYPKRGTIEVGGAAVRVTLIRTHGGPGDQPILIVAPDTAITGTITWRRYPTNDPWQTFPFGRNGDTLVSALPYQPPAGKLEYRVTLRRDSDEASFPDRPVVTRFKGDVPVGVLAPHVLMMILTLLLSTRAGIAAWVREPGTRSYAYLAAGALLAGGFVLGPIALWYAFGQWWEGIPLGWDLTDNKTLVAGLAWLWAVISMRGGREARGAVLGAAIVTLVVFAVPHSLFGSQIDLSAHQ
jgi:hypothetical protein